MSSQPILAKGLEKSFGDVIAVDGLDLSVSSGTVYGFVGPNGAGKTTTLRMLAGLLVPDEGQAKIDGVDSRNRNELSTTLGYLPSETPLYEELTGREQLRYAAQFRRLSMDGKIETVLEKHGLLDAADRRIEGYSTGMQRKLGLAQATLHEPAVLLLDEPLNGLDPRAIRTVRQLIADASTSGTAVVISSHDLDTVESVCDQVGIIHDGGLVAEDEPENLSRTVGDLETAVLELTDA